MFNTRSDPRPQTTYLNTATQPSCTVADQATCPTDGLLPFRPPSSSPSRGRRQVVKIAPDSRRSPQVALEPSAVMGSKPIEGSAGPSPGAPLQPINQSAQLNRTTSDERPSPAGSAAAAAPVETKISPMVESSPAHQQAAQQKPQPQQKKKKLSFRQRLSRCGSGCKIKISKKNSNEMELEANNENARPPSQPSTPIAVAASGQVGDLVKGESAETGPNPSGEHAGHGPHKAGDQNHQGHCARNFFCWCCCCCSCTK